MMDLGQLRSFAEVAERGTVAAAAEARGYTPPAVSQHIAKLETELGFMLFDRIGRRLRLTSAGGALLPVALEMIDLERRGRELVVDAASKPTIVIAGLASAISSVVLPALAELAETLNVEIHEREDAGSLSELSLGQVDVALTQEYDDQLPSRDSRFVYKPVLRDQLRIALPPTMSASTKLNELSETRWLINGHDTLCAQSTISILGRAGIRPIISGTVADNNALLGLVAVGHGVTIAPESLIAAFDQEVIVATQDLAISRTIFAVSRRSASKVLNPVLEML